MSNVIYDLIIVGSGPASMFAAIKLIDNGYKNIIIIEKGKKRSNNVNENVTEGWSGASGFSDSKVNLTHKSGGTIYELTGLKKFYEYVQEQDQLWLRFQPTDKQRKKYNLKADVNERLFTPNAQAEKLRAKALANHMDLLTFPIRHLGTENVFYIGQNIYDFLIRNGVQILVESEVFKIEKDENIFNVSFTKDDKQESIQSKNVLLTPGRSGSQIFLETMKSFNLKLLNNGVDAGIRFEAPAEIGEFILDYGIYEPKFTYYSKLTKSKVRSFCYSPFGNVALEEYRNTGIKTVNGHSKGDGERSRNLNFSVLVTETFTEPFNNPQAYAESICKLANLLAGGDVLLQRLGDLRSGRRSTPQRIREGATIPTLDATPGDLSLCIPQRYLTAIMEFLEVMDKVIPGINSDHGLLYGMEMKFYSNKVEVDNNSMTKIDGLYVGGDGAGLTRGLAQASVNGLIVADALLNKK